MPPRLAIVIPVWNDAAALAGCLDRLRAAGTPAAEIVIADASPDPDEQRRIEDLAARHRAQLVRTAAPAAARNSPPAPPPPAATSSSFPMPTPR